MKTFYLEEEDRDYLHSTAFVMAKKNLTTDEGYRQLKKYSIGIRCIYVNITPYVNLYQLCEYLQINQFSIEFPLWHAPTNFFHIRFNDHTWVNITNLFEIFDAPNQIEKMVKNSKESSRKFKTYLMSDSNTGLTKIGKAINPKIRERTLQSEKPTIVLFAICNDNIEYELQYEYDHVRIRGEWFDLRQKHIDEIINSYNFQVIESITTT